MIIFVPGLTFDFSEPLFAVLSLLACVLIFIGLQPAIVGYFLKRMHRIERLFAALSAAAFMLFIYDKHLIWFAGGLGMLSIFVVRQIWVLKKYSQGIDAGRVKG
jgi:hypothetical protein